MSTPPADWKRRRSRILGLAVLVAVVEAIGMAAGLPAWIMNLLRMGEVQVAGRLDLASGPARRRLTIAFGALTLLEGLLLVLPGSGAYVGLVWVLRIFLYPQALLFTTPSGGEVRYAWLWAMTLGVMLLAFLAEKALESLPPVWDLAVWGASFLGAATAVMFAPRVYRAVISLKFATVCLVLLTMLSMVGTLVVQRPPVDPAQYPEKFAAGQVGFVVNAEALFRFSTPPEVEQAIEAQKPHAADLATAFGSQSADGFMKKVKRYAKNEYVRGETDRRIRAHAAEVAEVRTFLDGIYFTRMFQSWAFNYILGLLVLSLVAVIVSKYPFGRYGWGPVVAHAGIVLIIVGCVISDFWLEKGSVRMSPVGPQRTVDGFADGRGVVTGEFEGSDLDGAFERIRGRVAGAARVEFTSGRKFAVAELGADGAIHWFTGGGQPVEDAEVRRVMAGWRNGTFEAQPRVDLPFRLRMTAGRVDYYHELRISAPRLDGHGRPVQEGYPLRPGKEIELFGGKYEVKILEVHPFARIAGAGAAADPAARTMSLHLDLPEDGGGVHRDVPAEAGRTTKVTTALGTYEVEVVTLAGNYAQHEQGVPYEDQDDGNPAARVRVKDPNGEEQTVWVFSMFPQFYAEGAMGARNEKVRVTDLTLSLPEAAGGRAEAPIGDADVTPVTVEVDELPAKDLEPVVKVRLTEPGGKTTERWLRLAEKDGRTGTERLRPPGDPQAWLPSEDGEIVVRLAETGQQSVYETHVEVLAPAVRGQDDRVLETHVIRVNQPLLYGGYRFYQSSYNEGRGAPVSGLTVKYDQGIPIIYLGFLVCMTGIVFAFYVLPSRRRRAEARQKAEFGKDIRKGLEF